MSDVGQELAIKRAYSHWRVYEVLESEQFGRYGKVLRGEDGEVLTFANEDSARSLIESYPDATEVEFPS